MIKKFFSQLGIVGILAVISLGLLYLQFRPIPDEILREHDLQLRFDVVASENRDEDAEKIITELKNTLKKLDNRFFGGIGLALAAPQLGYNQRIVALRTEYGQYQEMINPQIIAKKWPFVLPEMCFSTEGIHLVKRHLWIQVSYQDSDGKEREDVLRWGKASVLQQEIDHLNGVLITDSKIDMMVFWFFFAVTLLHSFIAIFSLLFPALKLWPPPAEGSWQHIMKRVLAKTTMIGIPIVTFLDWGSLDWQHWSLSVIGAILVFFGFALLFWSASVLGPRQTYGLKGKLLTKGPYKISRNPQYVGAIIFLIGLILISGSFLLLVNASIFTIWFLLAPFSEEPWMRKQYGDAYDHYCHRTPRFL